MSTILFLIGLACMIAAGFVYGLPAGLFVTGLSLWAFGACGKRPRLSPPTPCPVPNEPIANPSNVSP